MFFYFNPVEGVGEDIFVFKDQAICHIQNHSTVFMVFALLLSYNIMIIAELLSLTRKIWI